MQKPDFAWIAADKIKHYEKGREECMPAKKDKKYKVVMSAVREDQKLMAALQWLLCSHSAGPQHWHSSACTAKHDSATNRSFLPKGGDSR